MKNKKRFILNSIELADYSSYCIIDQENKKVVCHLPSENGKEYCKEMGNKMVDFLNEEKI